MSEVSQRIQFFATPWTIAYQALPSIGFSRQEYWSGLPCPPPGGLPNPGIKHESVAPPALAGRLFTTSATWEAHTIGFSSAQSLSRVRLFATPRIAARQASLFITISRSSFRLTSIESMSHPAISSSVVPFSSCPRSLPASESFPMSQLFA